YYHAFLVTVGNPLEYSAIPIEPVEVNSDHRGLGHDGDFKTASRIICSRNRITRFGEILLRQIERGWIAVDHQRGAFGVGQWNFSFADRRNTALDLQRQGNSKGRTLTQATRHADLASEHLH